MFCITNRCTGLFVLYYFNSKLIHSTNVVVVVVVCLQFEVMFVCLEAKICFITKMVLMSKQFVCEWALPFGLFRAELLCCYCFYFRIKNTSDYISFLCVQSCWYSVITNRRELCHLSNFITISVRIIGTEIIEKQKI